MVSLDDPKLRSALDEELPRMSFGDHLDELRKRLLRSLAAVIIAIVAILPFKEEVTELILGPYRLQWRAGFLAHIESLQAKVAAATATGAVLDKDTPRFLEFCLENKDAILGGSKEYTFLLPQQTGYPVPYGLYAVNGLEDMMAFMWASLVFALVIASPVVVWQAWAFIAAGLYKNERTAFYRYFPLMAGLMMSGIAFGYFLALPYSLGFLIRMMDPNQVNAIFSVGQYLTLLFALTGAMGLVFQLPVVMLALQRIGLVSHETFVKNWRLTILIIFIVAAVVTPPDPMSMLLMAGPMLFLYGVGLVMTRFHRRRDPQVTVS